MKNENPQNRGVDAVIIVISISLIVSFFFPDLIAFFLLGDNGPGSMLGVEILLFYIKPFLIIVFFIALLVKLNLGKNKK